MAQFKIPIGGGTPPYQVVVKNFPGTVVHNISNGQSDELEVPDSVMNSLVGGIEYTVTDSQNKSGTRRIDLGTLRCMKRLYIGFSMSNGDPENHANALIEGESLGYSYVGIIHEFSSIQNDQQLYALEASGKFDWQPALPSTLVYGMDKTIWTMKRMNVCNQIRWNDWLKRDLNKANNGTTITKFLNMSDSMMRPDGVTPMVRESGNSITDIIVPSYAAENTFIYASRLQLATMKRYVDYLNAGDIIGKGNVMTNNGEGEIVFQYKAGDTDETVLGSGHSHGDFHPESMAKFRARFPEHDGADNYTIAVSARNSQLNIDWRWHNNQLIIDFENRMAKHLKDNLPALIRERFCQMDSGSFVDYLAFSRCTLNITERARNPYAFLYKSNDGSDLPQNKVNFYLDQIATAAHMGCGIAIVEPSPPVPYETQEHFPYIVYEMQQAAARGIGTSFYSPQSAYTSQLLAASGLVPGSMPKAWNPYKIVNGQKRLIKHELPLSQVLAGGAMDDQAPWLNSWLAHKNTHGLVHVDTRTYDDVKPNLGA